MVTVQGLEGAVRHGYQTAAVLGRWTLSLPEALPRRYRLSADVRESSEYWLAQEPLVVAVVVGGDEWSWRDVEPVVRDRRLVVDLPGPPLVLART